MKKIITIIAAIFIAVSAFAGTGITGFLPQKTGYKQNFTPDEIADYAFQGAKPDITPSNKFWDDNYDVYASYLKDQIVTWMRAETGNPNLSEAQAEAKFRKMPVRKTTGKVEATGLSINQATGEILGLAQPIERDPYETTDGLGEYEIYGKKGAMSCACCNTHLGIEATQDDDEWEDEAPAPKKNTSSKKFTVPAGSEITINNYNYAYGGDAKAEAKADAKNEAPKVSGYVDNNEDPQIIRKKPKVIYEEDDDQTTTTRRKNGCTNCNDNSTKYVVVQEKTTPGQKLYRFGQWLNGAAQGTGTLLHGIAGYQGKLGTKITNVINNFIPGSSDNPGDGGDLPSNPDDPGDGGDLPGDGGGLPGLR